LLGDPHLLEGGEQREDGAADPDRVLALGRDIRSAMPEKKANFSSMSRSAVVVVE
jgi:hypothetical protein